MYLSDRNRIEICLPAQMMLTSAIAGVPETEQGKEDFLEFKKNLIIASKWPISDLDTKKRNNLLRRLTRLHENIHAEVIGNDAGNIPKLALVQFHLIRIIIEDGYLDYPEDGPFAVAVIAFMEALQHHANESKLNTSAIKQAKKLLLSLQDGGFYRGVTIPD